MGAAKKRRTVEYLQRLADREIAALVVQDMARLKEKQADIKKLAVESNEENQNEVANIG